MKRRDRPELGWGNRLRGIARVSVAIAGPVAATGIASIPRSPGTTLPALLYLLAVLASASLGQIWLALLTAALSFLGLDYFFSPPANALFGSRGIDLLAVVVFLGTAAAVSSAVARAIQQRAIADLRGRQLEALYAFMVSILSGRALTDALSNLAASLLRTYGAHGCRIVVGTRPGQPVVEATAGHPTGAATHVVPLVAEVHPVGRIELYGPSPLLGRPHTQEMKAFAAELALALERTRLDEEAAQARRQVESSRARAALFSSVTHDLKTPLASIKTGASSLLQERRFSPADRDDLVLTILQETERLERLVANIMDLSRLRSGSLTPSPEPIFIEEVVASVLRRLRPLLADRAVSVHVGEDVPPVLVDVVQMDQVISNILENAVRFSSSASPVDISVRTVGSEVEARVSDRGPGIPAAIRREVFQEFVRSDADGRPAGTGLGLAIAHAIMLAHHGSIWIEETPGGGTTLVLRLRSAGSAPEPERERPGR